jgi:uncharacterized protein YbaR (Trm112 family)
MTKTPLKEESLEIQCPHCEAPNRMPVSAFRRKITEFASSNLACHRCGLWMRVDVFVGASYLAGTMPPIKVGETEDPPE